MVTNETLHETRQKRPSAMLLTNQSVAFI